MICRGFLCLVGHYWPIHLHKKNCISLHIKTTENCDLLPNWYITFPWKLGSEYNAQPPELTLYVVALERKTKKKCISFVTFFGHIFFEVIWLQNMQFHSKYKTHIIFFSFKIFENKKLLLLLTSYLKTYLSGNLYIENSAWSPYKVKL